MQPTRATGPSCWRTVEPPPSQPATYTAAVPGAHGAAALMELSVSPDHRARLFVTAAVPRRPRIVLVVKRLLQRLVGLDLLFALIGRFVEGMGAVQCACASDCWCKRPAVSLFRWVFPWGHHCS